MEKSVKQPKKRPNRSRFFDLNGRFYLKNQQVTGDVL